MWALWSATQLGFSQTLRFLVVVSSLILYHLLLSPHVTNMKVPSPEFILSKVNRKWPEPDCSTITERTAGSISVVLKVPNGSYLFTNCHVIGLQSDKAVLIPFPADQGILHLASRDIQLLLRDFQPVLLKWSLRQISASYEIIRQ